MSAVLKLEPRLDSAQAGSLATAILEHSGGDLELDASGVSHFGALCLQVIRSAAKSWAGSGQTLRLTGLSVEATDQLHLLGFSPETLGQSEVG